MGGKRCHLSLPPGLLRSRWKHNPNALDGMFYTTHSSAKPEKGAARMLSQISQADFKAVAARQLVLYEREERELQVGSRDDTTRHRRHRRHH